MFCSESVSIQEGKAMIHNNLTHFYTDFYIVKQDQYNTTCQRALKSNQKYSVQALKSKSNISFKKKFPRGSRVKWWCLV